MELLTVNEIRNKFKFKLEEYILRGKLPNKTYSYTLEKFKKDKLESIEPIFFLSTGRTGTKLITNLLQKYPTVYVNHSPIPELIKESKLVYEVLTQNEKMNRQLKELMFSVFMVAREQQLYKAFNKKEIYVETNNRITFFAPIIKEFIPKAKFVYIHRHPGEFVRSGIRRGWYSGNHEHDVGRIIPNHSDEINWESLSTIQQISWLWNATNIFIEDFLVSLNKDDYIAIDFNSLNPDKLREITNFIGVAPFSLKTLEKHLSIKINNQNEGEFPVYKDWAKENKEELKSFCNNLAKKYGYEL